MPAKTIDLADSKGTMSGLKDNVGKGCMVEWAQDGRIRLASGTLIRVDDFESITISTKQTGMNLKIPFISGTSAIRFVTSGGIITFDNRLNLPPIYGDDYYTARFDAHSIMAATFGEAVANAISAEARRIAATEALLRKSSDTTAAAGSIVYK